MGGGYQQNTDSLIFSPFGELIPNLTQIALDNTNFSDTNAIGGIMQTRNTDNTIHATTGYLCGIPLKPPVELMLDSTNNHDIYFLGSATCISDVLHDKGYKQISINGYNADFGGTKDLLKTHHIEVQDAKYYKNIGKLSKEYKVNWGFEDSKVFEFAKEFLTSNKSYPFALYLPTLDTHFPGEYVDTKYCKDLEQGYENAVKCSDRIIGDFIDWVKKQDFYDDTTILILGDHLSMKGYSFPKDTHRRIYNAFINPHFSTTPTQNLTKNRHLSHFDISVLILDSLGFNIESFGLGRNPLTQKTLLEISNIDDFNRLIKQDSRLYESFWIPKNNEK